jgi:hypothetical protein
MSDDVTPTNGSFIPVRVMQAIEDEARTRGMTVGAVMAEKLLRAGHVSPYALEPHALEIRLRCMEIAGRWLQNDQTLAEYLAVCATLEEYAREGPTQWLGRTAQAPKPASKPAPKPAPPPEPDLTPRDIMALCLEIEAEAQHAGVGFFDLCTRHGINATSFQSWANGSVMPRAANVRKLQRIKRDGVLPQRQNGVDREPEREPAPEGKAP